MAEAKAPEPIASIEAEQALLGTVLMQPECLDALGFLEPEHLYEPVHADIYRLARERHQAGEAVSPVALKPVLSGHPGLAELGGLQYLARLGTAMLHPKMARDYAVQIVELYSRREIVAAAERASALAAAFDTEGGAGKAIASLESDMDTIRGQAQRRAPSLRIGKALTQAMERMVAAREAGPASPTGLAPLDRIIGGLYAGDLTLIGGRPSQGKTAVALSIARRIAKRGRAVIFASLEMQPEDLMLRMASEELREQGKRVPYDDARRGRLTDDEAHALMLASRDLESLPLDIIETHVRRLPALLGEIGRLLRQRRAQGYEIGAVVVDYIGLIQPPDGARYQNDNSRIGAVSVALQAAAGEHKVALVALSQLSRGVESREDKRPVMSDLRESGNLEQDAHNIVFAYREEYYLERAEPDGASDKWETWRQKLERARGRLDLIVAKQRMGPVGTARAHCDLATNSIWDPEP